MDSGSQLIGTVFDVKRCSLHDGPGIRTTVFLKGCPLQCLWCHNPESMSGRPEVLWQPEKCTGCGACAEVCPSGCHRMDSKDGHLFNRRNCSQCGRCAEVCLFGGLSIAGQSMSVEAVLTEVLKDKSYFETSGGGLTLSGGEPFVQADFSLALLKECKQKGLHTCVETCGFTSYENLQRAAEYTDLFLYDLKETNQEKHCEYTGQDNRLILDNLKKLSASKAKIILRCPIIPGLNDREDHFDGIAAVAVKLDSLVEINLMPYHPFAAHKRPQLGMDYSLNDISAPTAEQKEIWRVALSKKVGCVVRL